MKNKDIIENNLSYWKDRNIKAQAAVTQKNIDEINKQLIKYYKSAMVNTIADFESTYNHILKAVGEDREPTPADLYKLDKYWQTQAALKKNLEKLGAKEISSLERNFIKEWKEIYRELALKDDLNFSDIDDKTTKQLIKHIWCADGLDWSQRVWKNTDKLQEALNDSLMDCLVRGKKTSDLKKLIQKQFNVDFHRANTLVQTEMAHIQTEAARKRYEDAGIKRVQVWADADERRCDVCGKLHKTTYSIYDTLPIPAHPNCRCCIVPVREK